MLIWIKLICKKVNFKSTLLIDFNNIIQATMWNIWLKTAISSKVYHYICVIIKLLGENMTFIIQTSLLQLFFLRRKQVVQYKVTSNYRPHYYVASFEFYFNFALKNFQTLFAFLNFFSNVYLCPAASDGVIVANFF